MRRRLTVDRGLLGVIFAASVAARVYASGLRLTPLYYPDEYIYTALSRSIALTGVPRVRGDVLHLSSVLAPYMMSPAWLIGNVNTAYHVVLDLGAVSFSAAVFPAFALARRLGISERGALAVALLTVLVPDAALATTAMTEPYAYPLFVATFLVALDAVVSPTLTRQLGVLALVGVLCLARVQFGFILVVYLAAALVHEGSPRRLARRQPVVTGVMLGAIALVAVIGPSKLVGFYTFPASWSLLGSVWIWFGVNLFVVAIAAGWFVVPGAVWGFARLIRSADPVHRAFAVLAFGSGLAVVGQAAYVDAIQHRVHERYAFYVVPLVAMAFVWALERRVPNRGYAITAYAAATAAIIVPATHWLRDASSDQSPTLLGLQRLGGGGSNARLFWAIGLSVAAVSAGLLRSRLRPTVLLAIVVAAAVCFAGTRSLLRLVPAPETAVAKRAVGTFRLGAPAQTSLVAWAGTDRFTLMKTLFWTPTIRHVLMIGGGLAPDGFSSTPVRFRSSGGIVDSTGRLVDGPFAFAPDTTVLAPAARSGSPWLRVAPRAVVLGLERHDRYLNTVAKLLVASRPGVLKIGLELSTEGPRKTLAFACGSRTFDVAVSGNPEWVSLASSCRISLVKGAAVEHANRITSGVRVQRFTVVEPAR